MVGWTKLCCVAYSYVSVAVPPECTWIRDQSYYMSKGVLVNRPRFLKCLFVRWEKCNAFVDSRICNCLVMLSGWFECLLMYNGSSLGFLYGLRFALFRSKLTSKKFTTFKFTSAVIFGSNCSKILCNSFLVLSKAVSPSQKVGGGGMD
jgi:hypothetical protein